MNHIITCNQIGKLRSLNDPVEGFMVCHLYEKDAKFYFSKKTQLVFDIYANDEMSDEVEEYINEYSDQNVRYTEVSGLSEIPKLISEIMAYDYAPESLIDSDLDIELPSVIVAAEADFSKLFTASLNRSFRAESLEIEAMNMMQYYKFSDFSKMVDMIKRELDSEFIYPEDPLAFAYVINKMIRGEHKVVLA